MFAWPALSTILHYKGAYDIRVLGCLKFIKSFLLAGKCVILASIATSASSSSILQPMMGSGDCDNASAVYSSLPGTCCTE